MNPTNIASKERLAIKAWSEKLNATKTLATFTLSEDGLYADIVPSGEMSAYYQSLGLPKTSRGFELDLINSPFPTIAKSFGFNYDDPAVKHMIAKKTEGRLNVENVIALASEGFGQLGTLVSSTYKKTRVKEIALDSVIDPEEKSLPAQVFKTGSTSESSLKREGVLLRAGNQSLKHGYLITCEENDNERLALYAAGIKNMNSIKGLTSDLFVGFKMTADGRPAILCLDPTRPEIEVNAIKRSPQNNGGTSFEINADQLSLKAAQEPAGAYLRQSPEKLLGSFIAARQLKGLLQDVPGFQFNAPTVVDGKISQGQLSIPHQVSLKSFLNNAKEEVKSLGAYITRQAALYQHTFSAEQTKALRVDMHNRVASTFGDAKLFKNEIDLMVERHKIKEQRASNDERIRHYREYDITDLEV